MKNMTSVKVNVADTGCFKTRW